MAISVFPPFFTRKSSITRADQARDVGNWARAAALYKSALGRSPKNFPIWIQYGHSLKEIGRLTEAESAYLKATDDPAEGADAHLHLGHLFKIQGRRKEAESAYARSASLDPLQQDARRELANLALSDLWRQNLKPGTYLGIRFAESQDWYFTYGRRVSVAIPSYRDTFLLSACLHAIFATTAHLDVLISIADDNSGDPEHIAFLRSVAFKHPNVRVTFGEENIGFSGNANRAVAACDPECDIVLMNSDVIASTGWLQILQHAVYTQNAAIGGVRLVYPNGTIQFGAGARNIDHPIWFDHYYRERPAEYPPATIDMPSLFLTGALMYLRRDLLNSIGSLDPRFPMAFEDVDLCLRAWQKGLRCLYVGAASAVHAESLTRGKEVGTREQHSQEYFWQKHGAFFRRQVLHKVTGRPYVIFVTQDAGIGGGHRVIFSHINYLSKQGFTVALWNLDRRPEWFTLDPEVECRSFCSYHELTRALDQEDAIKFATWWQTAEPVWLGSVRRGIPAYHVQDIESSYYRDNKTAQNTVLSRYRIEFNYTTNCGWIKDELEEMRVHAVRVGLGYQSDTFRPLPNVARRPRTILVGVRGEPIKNFAYSRKILIELQKQGYSVIAFGSEGPALLDGLNAEYHASPDDGELCRLYNSAQFFIQTSIHEGFSLPQIEAMACGCVPIVTAAKGNVEFIRDGANCVVVPSNDVMGAVHAFVSASREVDKITRIAAEARHTAQGYLWDSAHRRMAAFLRAIVARPEYGLQIREADLVDFGRQ